MWVPGIDLSQFNHPLLIVLIISSPVAFRDEMEHLDVMADMIKLSRPHSFLVPVVSVLGFLIPVPLIFLLLI